MARLFRIQNLGAKFFASGILAFLLAGCTLAKVDVDVVSERTSLENQVLGTYNRLSSEVMLVASVRGITPGGKIVPPPPRSNEQQEAVDALETTAFHADDIDRFKRLGWLGKVWRGPSSPIRGRCRRRQTVNWWLMLPASATASSRRSPMK